jgi:hypothetical protein
LISIITLIMIGELLANVIRRVFLDNLTIAELFKGKPSYVPPPKVKP